MAEHQLMARYERESLREERRFQSFKDVLSERLAFQGALQATLRKGRHGINTSFRQELDRASYGRDQNSSSYYPVCGPAEVNQSATKWEGFITGVPVKFPFPRPLAPQLALMSKTVRALTRRENALIESPTGTGKTAALLSSLCAWQLQQELKNPYQAVPRIYYCTRTHSQVTQVARELQRSPYNPTMSILGSRDQLCINDQVLSGPPQQLRHRCMAAMRACFVSEKKTKQESKRDAGQIEADKNQVEQKKVQPCAFYQNLVLQSAADHVQRHLRPPVLSIEGEGKGEGIWDIEDLSSKLRNVNLGIVYRESKKKEAIGVIICPYNYIIDPIIRKAKKLELRDSVIVIDEAHNVEDVCREGGSLDLDLTLVLELLFFFSNFSASEERSRLFAEANEAAFKCKMVLTGMVNLMQDEKESFLRNFDANKTRSNGNSREVILREWSGFLQRQAAAQYQPFNQVDGFLLEMQLEMKAVLEARNGLSTITKYMQEAGLLDKLGSQVDAVEKVLVALCFLVNNTSDYVVYIKLRKRWTSVLSLWLMNSAVTFGQLSQQAMSIILASGTLAPMESFVSELGENFCIRTPPENRLEGRHVVDLPSQLLIPVVSARNNLVMKGVHGVVQTLRYQDELGECLIDLLRVIPKNVLVFLPSYDLLAKLFTRWTETGLLLKLREMKDEVLAELKSEGGDRFELLKERYLQASKRPKGGVLFAVYRGRVSEGISFNDDFARGVICVGIPYPNFVDAKVQKKRKYNDVRRAQGTGNKQDRRGLLVSGDHWYALQAFRALNQAIGRCLRHKGDYGTIVLLDSRFEQLDNQNMLAKWMRGAVRTYQSFEAVCQDISRFFRLDRSHLLQSETKAAGSRFPAPQAVPPSPSTSRRPPRSPYKQPQTSGQHLNALASPVRDGSGRRNLLAVNSRDVPSGRLDPSVATNSQELWKEGQEFLSPQRQPSSPHQGSSGDWSSPSKPADHSQSSHNSISPLTSQSSVVRGLEGMRLPLEPPSLLPPPPSSSARESPLPVASQAEGEENSTVNCTVS